MYVHCKQIQIEWIRDDLNSWLKVNKCSINYTHFGSFILWGALDIPISCIGIVWKAFIFNAFRKSGSPNLWSIWQTRPITLISWIGWNDPAWLGWKLIIISFKKKSISKLQRYKIVIEFRYHNQYLYGRTLTKKL